MSAWVVVVRIEETEDAEEWIYGPFRAKERAVEFAAKVGKAAGLNLNTWGSWYGTDGDTLFASVVVRKALTLPRKPGEIGLGIRERFNAKRADSQ